MNRTKLGFFTLILIIGATILVPVLLTDIALADCGASVRDSEGYNHCAFVGELLRCDVGAVRDYDRSAVRDCDHCAGEYRCNLSGCGWIR